MMNSLLLLFVRWDVHPTLFTFGPVEIRYYGLMWALAIRCGMLFIAQVRNRVWLPQTVSDSLLVFGTLGTM